jgi:hypothetical protein
MGWICGLSETMDRRGWFHLRLGEGNFHLANGDSKKERIGLVGDDCRHMSADDLY